jgi:hypothetical protein
MKPKSCLLIVAAALGWASPAGTAALGGRIVHSWRTNAQVGLQFETATSRSYQVQSSPGGQGQFWSDVTSPVSAADSFASVLVPAQAGAGFFRVLEFTNRVFWYDWKYCYENPCLSAWGLGAAQTAYVHTDRPYDWYIDQADTGACANNNCGPSCVTMGIKWYNPAFNKTVADARNTYFRDGGWWYTSDVINYLRLYGVPSTTSAFTGTNQLMGVLSQTNLVILCLNTAYLMQNAATEYRVGRFYDFASGHFLVVKGWRKVGSALFFEVYDPNNWHAAYADRTPKGRNRHLPAAELADAIANWWNYLIVIPPPGGGANLATSAWLTPVDPDRIVHACGM